MNPYLPGYMFMLWTIKGPTKHDVGVGYRTQGKRAPLRAKSTMEDVGIVEVMSQEWLDSIFMTSIALGHPTEADSDGSMLTRAALVFLYAMLDAQLAVVSQWGDYDKAGLTVEGGIACAAAMAYAPAYGS